MPVPFQIRDKQKYSPGTEFFSPGPVPYLGLTEINSQSQSKIRDQEFSSPGPVI